MAVNLFTKYQNKLAALYNINSFVKGKTSKDWEWDGAAHIKILSPVTQDLNNYDRTAAGNRYGTPAELQDLAQTISVDQDKSFSIVIDDGNNTQQGMMKRAGEVLQAEVAEKVVPTIDTFALGVYALLAGKVIDAGASLTSSNIIAKLTAMEDAMSDALMPMEGRYVFMKNANVSLFRQALTNCDNITDKILLKGIVGKLGSLNIVGVPASWMPKNIEAVAFQSKSVVLPEQIAKAIIHENPQGFNGNVLEGRYLFGAGVVGAFCGGCVALTANGKKASVSLSKSTHTVTATGTNTDTIIYTVDGSDPRYSDTAKTYSAAVTLTSGQVFKAFGYTAAGQAYWASDVASEAY